jgi:hypothetical protein
MKLLDLVSDKDLRDTKAEILSDHLAGFVNDPGADVLNPRVANEMLVGYRAFLTKSFGPEFIAKTHQDPGYLIEWVRREIRINTTENYYNTPLTPVGVYQLKVADPDSRKIFTVACLRTFGIPARLKPGTLTVEYLSGDRWVDVDFGESTGKALPDGTLVLVNDPANPVKPQYETHYTLARFDQGKYKTLAYGYDYGDPLAGPVTLPQGHYLLVTGNRIPGGTVLSNLTFFELKGGEKKEVRIILRKSGRAPESVGILVPDWTVKAMDNKPFDWKQIVKTDRAILCWVEPDKEPSKHVFNDLGTLKAEIDKLDCPFVFLVPENKLPAGFTPDSWKSLPASTRFVTVTDLESLSALEKATGKTLSAQLPVVIRIHQDGKITYLSSGYKIGIGEEIIQELERN